MGTTRASLAVVALAVACAGCGDDTQQPPVELSLTVWNRSLFELEEVRTHATASYQGAPNLLQQPLPDDGRIEVDFTSGDFVTVIRRKVEAGARVAFTTAWGLDVNGSGYVLEVFQEQFRLTRPAGASEQ